MIKNKLEKIRLCLSNKRGKNIRQKVFARFLGITPNQYSKWKRHDGEPSLQSYWKFSAKLKIPINDFIDEYPD